MKLRHRKTDSIFHSSSEPEPDYITDIRDEILEQSSGGGRVVMWMIIILTVLSFLWAFFSEVDEVTKGNGKVIPSGQIQVVQNLEGGIVSEINVNIGDIVEKGQQLLRIDGTRFSASFHESRLKFIALKAKAARFQAETLDTSFVIPAEVIKEHPEIGEREQELFLSRKQSKQASLEILQEQIMQREQELIEMKAKVKDLTRSYNFLKKELKLTKPLLKDGAISEVELLRLERQTNGLHGELEATRLAIPRIESKHKESKRALQEEKLGFYNAAKSELNDVLTELSSLSVSSVALADQLKRTSVRSPVRGTINRILVNTVGGVIRPGMDLVEIVPLEDTLLIEVKIKPQDIAFLHPDQNAIVKFTAYDFSIYGGLKAQLEYISADSILDSSGNSFYQVRVRTDKNHLGGDDSPLPLITGMVATVDILTGKKTILSYLLKPILKAKNNALRER